MKTDSKTDRYFINRAIDELSKVSSPLEIADFPEIDISKLKQMFYEASATMRMNPQDKKLNILAECLFYSCVNVSRCVLVDDPHASYALYHGKTYHLEAKSQFDNALRNYSDFNEYKNSD